MRNVMLKTLLNEVKYYANYTSHRIELKGESLRNLHVKELTDRRMIIDRWQRIALGKLIQPSGNALGKCGQHPTRVLKGQLKVSHKKQIIIQLQNHKQIKTTFLKVVMFN